MHSQQQFVSTAATYQVTPDEAQKLRSIHNLGVRLVMFSMKFCHTSTLLSFLFFLSLQFLLEKLFRDVNFCQLGASFSFFSLNSVITI